MAAPPRPPATASTSPPVSRRLPNRVVFAWRGGPRCQHGGDSCGWAHSASGQTRKNGYQCVISGEQMTPEVTAARVDAAAGGGRGDAASSNSAVPLTRAMRFGAGRTVPNACDGRRRSEAGWRVP
jgi:hypothetical protein